MQWVELEKCIKVMGKGKSKAQLFICEDGQKYVVKFYLPYERKRACPNEWLASRLGGILDLPILTSRIIYIPKSLIKSISTLKKRGVRSGPHFGSCYLEDVVTAHYNTLLQCENHHKLADMLVFDIWINNRDRKNGHILITNEKPKRLLLFDHDFSFGSKEWEIEDIYEGCKDLNPKWGVKQKKYIKLVPNKNLVYKALNNVQSVKRSQIIDCVDQIPDEWGVTKNEKKALVNYLDTRKDFIEPFIADVAERYF